MNEVTGDARLLEPLQPIAIKCIQKSAKRAYARFRQNPNHPNLRLKKVHTTQEIYSVRVIEDYRALGVREGDTIVWFWIGSHADYERILKGL